MFIVKEEKDIVKPIIGFPKIMISDYAVDDNPYMATILFAGIGFGIVLCTYGGSFLKVGNHVNNLDMTKFKDYNKIFEIRNMFE